MRYLPNVIDEMLAVIPGTETDFIAQLESRKSSAEYSAPESMGTWWKYVADILVEKLGNPPFANEWQNKLVAIWMDTK
jgi:hypothetical protein